jgi:hypothetical protein
VFRFPLWAILAALRPKALLVAENLCLRQQLLVLQRRQPRPYLKTIDRFFWVLASRWLGGWRDVLLVVKPKTVLKWHQRGWRLYWSWRSRMIGTLHNGFAFLRPTAGARRYAAFVRAFGAWPSNPPGRRGPHNSPLLEHFRNLGHGPL